MIFKIKSELRLLPAAFVWLMSVAFSILHAQENTTNQASPSISTNLPGPALYKKMNLQELMNVDVTSVAKEPQPYGQAPAGD